MDWQPIETAPDTGCVLVWLPEAHHGSHVHAMRRGRAAIIGSLFHWDVGEPTHWMPLPAAPKTIE